ncbi:hypothetical protein LTR95_018029 [Oleoguttula sp. CCFEE 5521]
MSAQYSSYPGYGSWAEENYHYSQAVRIGNVLKISGQGPPPPRPACRALMLTPSSGGWDPKSAPPEIVPGIDAQIDQAFANVDLTLKTAGGAGWSQVYSVRGYHVFTDRAVTMAAMVRNLKKLFPDHRPIWTAVGVTVLGAQGMEVEIEVEAMVE